MAIQVTNGWAWDNSVNIIRSLHRISLGLLSAALFINAGLIYENESNPRVFDFLVQLALLISIAFSGIRHRLVVHAQKQKENLDVDVEITVGVIRAAHSDR